MLSRDPCVKKKVLGFMAFGRSTGGGRTLCHHDIYPIRATPPDPSVHAPASAAHTEYRARARGPLGGDTGQFLEPCFPFQPFHPVRVQDGGSGRGHRRRAGGNGPAESDRRRQTRLERKQ